MSKKCAIIRQISYYTISLDIYHLVKQTRCFRNSRVIGYKQVPERRKNAKMGTTISSTMRNRELLYLVFERFLTADIQYQLIPEVLARYQVSGTGPFLTLFKYSHHAISSFTHCNVMENTS